MMLVLYTLPRLFWLVLAMMTEAVPTADPLGRHGELATAITIECLADPYAGGDEEVTASIDVAVGFRESTLKKDAVGDGGQSFGAFQWFQGDRAVLEDAALAVRVAHRMIRASRRGDPAHPLAHYARGPRGLPGGSKREEAVAISDDRIRLAARLLSVARKKRDTGE